MFAKAMKTTYFRVHLKIVPSQSHKYIWNGIKSISKLGQIDPVFFLVEKLGVPFRIKKKSQKLRVFDRL